MFSFQIVENLDSIPVDKNIFIGVISSDDSIHPARAEVSFLYLRTIEDEKKVFLLPLKHNEFTKLLSRQSVAEWLKSLTIKKFVLDKKNYLHFFDDNNSIDINSLYFLDKYKTLNEESYDTIAHTSIKNRCFSLTNVNFAIPVLKFVEKYDRLYDDCLSVIIKCEDAYNEKLNNELIYNLYSVEKNGLKIDSKIFLDDFGKNFVKHITKNGYVYSSYNIYTATGRPSNRFGGVNYSALNKANLQRKFFTSRHDDGYLLMYDYSAFHPRLITTMIDYDIPFDVDVYDYLGRMYFRTSTLTEEQREEAKKLTFKLMYGGITKEYMHVEYFKKIHDFSNNLWEFFQTNGYIETPIFEKRIKKCHIQEPFPSKVFNYMLQAYETEVGSQVISDLRVFLDSKKTKLVLYQYDGFLFDFDKSDGKEVLTGIRDILVMNNKFPIKVKAGKNFQDLTEIKV